MNKRHGESGVMEGNMGQVNFEGDVVYSVQRKQSKGRVISAGTTVSWSCALDKMTVVESVVMHQSSLFCLAFSFAYVVLHPRGNTQLALDYLLG